MPIDPDAVQSAIRGGLSFICATCNLYWSARDSGVDGDRCLSDSKCGSPIAGDDFHSYQGPLGTGMDKVCFVCGAPSSLGVRARGRQRIVGICDSHLPLLKELEPTNSLTPGGLPQLIGSKGYADLDRLCVRKPSLFSAIQEAELYFDEQASRGKKG